MATVETLDARLAFLETARTELKHLATKADLKDLEVSLGGRIDKLDGQIGKVDGRIDKLEARMVKWAVGLLVALLSVLVAMGGVGVGLALLIQRAL